jgi:hypothetical protein
MSRDICIANGKLSIIERSDTDATILPDLSLNEGVTLISKLDWTALVNDAGSEIAVMKSFGITEDLREDTKDIISVIKNDSI